MRAPRRVAPALRGRPRPERGARLRRRSLEPEPRAARRRARRSTVPRARRPATARRCVRELKAVGGDLKALRLALTGRERGPELWASCAALPRDEPLRQGRCGSLTRSRALGRASSPRRPARSGCTSAGRPSTSASTSATRGRSCSRCGCGAGCGARLRGQLVDNITDVNDKIYEAAPAASAELAADATEWYLEDTDGARPRPARLRAPATETIPADRRRDRAADRARARV